MLDKFYITPGQWRHFFRWTLYSLLFLSAMILQTVIWGDDGFLGQNPHVVAVAILTVCMVEGPERGGLFALLSSTFWALSGIDRGALQILCLTTLPILSVYWTRKLFSISYIPDLLSCGLILFITNTVDFLLRMFYDGIPGYMFFTRLLPGIVVTLLFQPLIYWLVKSMEKIGDPYEAK